MTLFPQVVALLKKKGLTDVLIFGGGIIPDEDVAALRKKGVHRIFGPGTPLPEIVAYLNETLGKKKR
jgi:methylmalonyl-CoA mutase C-terminal domain/subunit